MSKAAKFQRLSAITRVMVQNPEANLGIRTAPKLFTTPNTGEVIGSKISLTQTFPITTPEKRESRVFRVLPEKAPNFAARQSGGSRGYYRKIAYKEE